MEQERLTFGITGARGFIGSELTMLLRERGHEVVPLTRTRPAGELSHIPFALERVPGPAALRDLDVLVHAAYDFRYSNPEEHRSRNIQGSITLLKNATAAGVPHIVFISTLSTRSPAAARHTAVGSWKSRRRRFASGRSSCGLVSFTELRSAD